MFRDECEIEVRAGKGGDGLVSFRREKHVPKGGPDGGDGGRGGSVFLVASEDVHSLLDIGRRPRHVARNGQPGGPSHRTGRDGEDLVLDVPVGTQVLDPARGNLLRDLARGGVRLELARGGAGGRGNASFTNAVRQAPRHATPGEPGEQRRVRLVLKLFAEVGLVGLPNAGKSTFLARVTAATPRIADYPFTTLVPQVGIARVGDYDTLVLADLPGLIEGAAEGHGLGDRFLRHVERCAVLLQLVDVSDGALTEPLEAWRVIDRELARSSPQLAAKPRLVVASKCEGAAAEERAAALEAELGRGVLRISALQGRGLRELLRAAQGLVRGSRPDAEGPQRAS
jgi:GTP-binding protein